MNTQSDRREHHFRYQPVAPDRMCVAIHQIPTCKELASITKLHDALRQAIPFFFEVLQEPTLAAIICEPGKKAVLQVQLIISHELELDEAIYQLGQNGFLEATETTII